jgi:hypothetical protein
MAPRKDPKSKENQARKPVSQKAIADTSGSNLADFKNKAVDAAKVVASRVAVGPMQLLLSNKQVKSVASETSGISDVKRLAKNPSASNAGMVVLSAAQYVAPLVKPIQAIRAADAASKAKALPIAASALTKTMKFTKVAGVPTGVLRGKGADVAVSGFKLAETAKSPARIAASRASNASQRVIQKGKQAESNLNSLAAGNALRQTTRATEPKRKKK